VVDRSGAGPDRIDPSALRWLIGHELRAAREQAGHTQSAAARVLGCTHAKINYLEQGKNQQRPDEVGMLLRSYGAEAGDVERLASLAAAADRGTWWAPFADVVPDWLRTFVGLEGLASTSFAYEPLLLHGLLQTRAYATAVESVEYLPVTREEIGRRVDNRIARQEVLRRAAEPLVLHAVVDESVLRRCTGDREVMTRQLDHLVDMADRPNIDLRIMTLDARVYPAAFGAFQLLTSPCASAPYVACAADVTGFRYHENRAAIDAHATLFEYLSRVSLAPDDSVERIQDIAKELSRD